MTDEIKPESTRDPELVDGLHALKAMLYDLEEHVIEILSKHLEEFGLKRSAHHDCSVTYGEIHALATAISVGKNEVSNEYRKKDRQNEIIEAKNKEITRLRAHLEALHVAVGFEASAMLEISRDSSFRPASFSGEQSPLERIYNLPGVDKKSIQAAVEAGLITSDLKLDPVRKKS